MIAIIPNWHPIFVHFAIGLLFTAAVLFGAGALVSDRPAGATATTVGRWNLAIGLAFAVASVATGHYAYATVVHDGPAHDAMQIHLAWAWITLVLFTAAAALAWRERGRKAGAGALLGATLLAGAITLTVTGYLGAENVYRHGIGVQRLPDVHEHGHGHGRAGDGEHDHLPGPMANPEQTGVHPHDMPDRDEALTGSMRAHDNHSARP